MPSDDFRKLWTRASPGARGDLLRARFRYNLREFAKFCFPEQFRAPFVDSLHDELMLQGVERPGWREREAGRGRKWSLAAPRGYAKSTIGAFLVPIFRLVYGLEAVIMVISVTGPDANKLSDRLRSAFVSPTPEFAALYGPFKVVGGVEQWSVRLRDGSVVGVVARTPGGNVRGYFLPATGIRPTYVLLDDAEDKDDVRNGRLRDEWWSWLSSDVMYLGARGSITDIGILGTILHTDSGLSRVNKDPGWESQLYKAILSWPTPRGRELWERCRQIWADLTLGKHREGMARAFYEQNKAEMDEGVEVLDPDLEPIFTLYLQIWSQGLAGFLREKQNDPVDPSAQVFVPAEFQRFRIDGDEIVTSTGRRVSLHDLRKFAFWDPTVGGPGGDYGAIAVLGRDKLGYTYVLDVWLGRVKPNEQLQKLWELCEHHAVRSAGYEDNGFQTLVAADFEREKTGRREAGRYWRLDLIGRRTTENKERRIAAMQPATANGWLLFNERLPGELDAQYEAFPNAAHDDGPDAVERAHTELGGAPVKLSDTPLGQFRGQPQFGSTSFGPTA